MNTAQILSAIDEEISRLQQARKLLEGTATEPSNAAPEAKRRGRPPGMAKPSPAKVEPLKPVRGMSEEGRARVAAAQKARWAAKKKAEKAAAPPPAAMKVCSPAKKAAPLKKSPDPAKATPPAKAAKPAGKAAPVKTAPVKTPAKAASAGKKTPSSTRPEPVEPQEDAPATPIAESPAGE